MSKTDYSIETCKQLEQRFNEAQVIRPLRASHYEPGDELGYEVMGVSPARAARVRLRVEKFVGGGFAGQVYRVRVLEITPEDPEVEELPHGLQQGDCYAMKILIPPSSFSRRFRDLIYALGFQAQFSLQVNPDAARAGALWQKFIRRAARAAFGSERTVVDILATFVDTTLGSCGELSEWVDGRTWRFEVNDRLDAMKQWRRGKPVDEALLGSPEYRAKKQFMARFVSLLHELGAPEFARQYEWWTAKSQPNCLKRNDAEEAHETSEAAGLTAVDFRAGLALLPFLPMAPGDVKLIFSGLARGSLVQFDRGDLSRLEAFVAAHAGDFEDMEDALAELRRAEGRYRSSMPDVTHNHLRLLYSGGLWSSILDASIRGWRIRNITDDAATAGFRRSRAKAVLFRLVGLVPLLSVGAAAAVGVVGLLRGGLSASLLLAMAALLVVVPFGARIIRKLWGRGDLRAHYGRMLRDASYLGRGLRAHLAETAIAWHQAGRISGERAEGLADSPWRFFWHKPLSILPARLHRFLTDGAFFASTLRSIFVRPLRLYFNAEEREQWLRDMLAEGRQSGMLNEEDSQQVESRIKEPYIQKYLKSLAVHVCTLPVTQVVSVIVAWVYVKMHPELTWQEAGLAAAGILVAFQLTPVSPGSLVRGLYVLYLVIRERNFKDYNIAVFLGFFKYIGYLAFPIQMAYRYPTLARFMAAHWATGAVHVVPVFGERGALLEHWVFDTFYNYPLTIRRRMGERAEQRRGLAPRLWHVPLIALLAAACLGVCLFLYHRYNGELPTLRQIWPAMLLVPLLAGRGFALLSGGASLSGRLIRACVGGLMTAVFFAAAVVLIQALLAGSAPSAAAGARLFGVTVMWPTFSLTVFSFLGAILSEIWRRP